MRNTDERLDAILHALNVTEAPARLEQRVMARATQRSMDVAEVSDSRFAGWQALVARLSPYAAGAAVALLLCAVYMSLSHRAAGTNKPVLARVAPPAPRTGDGHVAGRAVHVGAVREMQKAHSAAAVPVVAADDPDAIALAETLAPSHAAPPMPATPQELMAMRSGRTGHSVEMAELRSPHEPGFRTERERTVIRQYILGLLDPLVTAQNLTSSPPSSDDSPKAPAATDTTSTN